MKIVKKKGNFVITLTGRVIFVPSENGLYTIEYDDYTYFEVIKMVFNKLKSFLK